MGKGILSPESPCAQNRQGLSYPQTDAQTAPPRECYLKLSKQL